MQNFIELTAAVHELSYAQRKKLTKTVQSVASVRTVITNQVTTDTCT